MIQIPLSAFIGTMRHPELPLHLTSVALKPETQVIHEITESHSSCLVLKRLRNYDVFIQYVRESGASKKER